ncbi:riboflavin kinase [Catenulispora sp. NF23]|uniref:riboflavin kinase n=1 Tax=Catenulispora pinistramenti TaxID=2705254 RepID=A0ABS5L0R4_9ACTN|nr:riboflavin kinase [Catenulispora pinistramenti]MBS2535396.1 riboflavin kinase [Catenulispora pinistramenti]MBS2551922.1 riboflavin kinase [Catenulispora pinistramenti]
MTVQGAGGWLGKVVGTVVHGAGRGRGLGFPTANVAPDPAAPVPPAAIYAGLMARPTHGSLHPVTVSIGTNPTFCDGNEVHIEVYCHDLHDQLYGEHVVVWLVTRIRDTVRFGSVQALVAAAAEDVETTTATLTEEHRARALAELCASPSHGTQQPAP